MMIHVFYVNRGEMLTFDLCLAMGSVSKLHEAIRRDMDIPEESQVLLISGGEAMLSDVRVSKYSAGTDTCPIFLFNLKAIEEKFPPEITVNLDADTIKKKIEGSINMAPTLATLSTRTHLALELRDLSHRSEELCKSLVHHQHLQHQGWCTVVANLEDSLQAFTVQADAFIAYYPQFVENKSQQLEMLQEFSESYRILSKLPILASLTDVMKRPGKTADADSHSAETLVEFLSNLDNNQDLLAEAESALAELTLINSDVLNRIMNDRDKVVDTAADAGMKEVRGLENRLYSLEQLIVNARKIVKDQEDYAQGFVNNQRRCRQLADPHVLPDLCISHKAQLRHMEKHDDDLRIIVRRCAETKQELCANLHTRLRWIMYVEKKMTTLDGQIALRYASCRRLKHRLDKLEQIHRAPIVYAQLCAEVCRRRKFATLYKSWSQDAFARSSECHQREVEYRKELYRCIGTHFLKALFPELDKLPPPIVPFPVTSLDENLPCVTEEEIQSLRDALPELEKWLQLPNTTDPDFSIISSSMRQSAAGASTASDITVLSPRTGQDSTGSLVLAPISTPTSKVLPSSYGSPGITLPHTAPSTLESISADTNLDGDAFRPSFTTHAIDTPDPVAHMMARCVSFDDEDISAATDEDRAPASLTEENSGGFTTANFFLSDELESISGNHLNSTDMANTITIQHSEIEQLLTENAVYRQKCEKLTDLVQELASSVVRELSDLKRANSSVRQDFASHSLDFYAFQSKLLHAVQTAPILEKQEIDRQLEVSRSRYSNQISNITAAVEAKTSENNDLHALVDKLKLDYELSLSSKAAQLESAIQEAEIAITRQLTLEHELEIDGLRARSDNEFQSKESEIAAKDAEVESLRNEVQRFQELINAKSAVAKQRIETIGQEFDQNMETRIEEINAKHGEEVEALKGLLQHEMETAVNDALARQRVELVEKHKQEVEALVKPTADCSINTTEDFLSEELNKLRAELEQERLQVLSENSQQLEAKFTTEQAARETGFSEQIEELKQSSQQELESGLSSLRESLQAAKEAQVKSTADCSVNTTEDFQSSEVSKLRLELEQEKHSNEQELESRAAMMRESLQAAFEVRVKKARKEKDLLITELKRRLIESSQATKADSLTASTSTLTTSTSSASMTESVMPVEQSIQELQGQILERDTKIQSLQTKLNDMQMSASSIELVKNDKVSVKSCNKGDKVILCFNEQYQHYIVFCMHAALHFLHTDCLADLNLDPSSAERKPYILAEVVSKEYCEAKKARNRFNVPLNTKFYRVKAKPWGIEASTSESAATK